MPEHYDIGPFTGMRQDLSGWEDYLGRVVRGEVAAEGLDRLGGALRALNQRDPEGLNRFLGEFLPGGGLAGMTAKQASNIVSLGSRRQDIGQQTADKARALVAHTGLDLPADMTPAQVMSFIDHWGQFEAPDRLLGPLRELWRDWDKAQPGSGYR